MQASQNRTTFQSTFQVKRLLQSSSRDRNGSPISKEKTFLPFAEGIGLAHDAGNLLGALSLYADLLAAPALSSEELQIYAHEIKLIAERSLSLIERLVGCAGIASQDSETILLPEILANYRDLLSRLVGRTVSISILASTYKPIHVTREAIERILLNLVKNAAAATPTSAEIHVEVDRKNEGGSRYIVMTVTDDGVGMSASTVKMLQDNALPPRTSGRGFGFRIVQELVNDSGGSIEVSSRLGEGTKISVKWPDRKTGK